MWLKKVLYSLFKQAPRLYVCYEDIIIFLLIRIGKNSVSSAFLQMVLKRKMSIT